MTSPNSFAFGITAALRNRREPRRKTRILWWNADAVLLPVALAALIPRPALAQQALQEITVTAERRVEDVQTVPMSITVLDSTDLEQRDVQSFIDYEIRRAACTERV